MDEGTVGIAVLCFCSLLSAVFCHYFIPRFMVACFASAGIASLIFQIAAYLYQGKLDPFFVVALGVGGLIAFVIALLVGIIFRMFGTHDPSP